MEALQYTQTPVNIIFHSFKENIDPAAAIGGKARNLYRLQSLGLNVPEWVVIPEEALMQLLPAELKHNTRYGEITEFIRAITIPGGVIESIANELKDATYFAVRSSATDEDGSSFSFAGQFESYLYVTKEGLEESIKKIWISAFSERVRLYRENNGLPAEKGIAVIIQKMVNADAAGVGFGINPTNGNRRSKVISAVYGLGEGLVSGELNADNYILTGGRLETQLTEKTHKIVLDSGKGGTRMIGLTQEEKSRPVLEDQQAHQLAEVLDTLHKHTGKPQDIEFAFEKGKLYLLQTRPITNLHKIADINGDYIVWDNSNIIESYPGVTTPLTFSFIIKVYEAVYRQFCGMMGISKAEVEANSNVLANMLGLIEGRVYYNLLSWYKLLALLPGYSLNAEFMEKMMGVKERFELTDLPQRTKFSERMRVLNMIRIMLKNLCALPKMRKDFVREFNEVMEAYKRIDFDNCRAEELMRLYMGFEQTLLKKWKAPLVNDFYAMIYFGVLQKLIAKYGIAENSNLHNDLLCGARDIISTEPVRMSLTISTLIQEDSGAKDFFLRNGEHEIWRRLCAGEFPEVKNSIDSYIERFGERCVGELKLETITYSQDPASFVRIIKSYVAQGVTTHSAHSNIDIELRVKAEAAVDEKLRGRPLKRIIFNYFLRGARSLVSNRENLRYERTRAFGVVRQIFCAMGRRFYAEGILEHPRDIFYLKKEEIFEFIQGASVNKHLKSLVALRKEEFASFGNEMPSERIATRGIVYHGNDFRSGTKQVPLDGDLKGIGCCPGRVKGKVRIVLDPREVEDLNGDILVTSSTDPGWVTLFPTASAILVERGSLLSHSAIVSREMGKPCIVGITGILHRLKTGDIVEMDGSTGEIKIIVPDTE
jgi:rifampicin phosphotransferase